MKKRIRTYRARIDSLLIREPELMPKEKWEKILEEHLVQISFFQHERLVHLLVTLAFALFTLATIITIIFTGYYPLIVLGMLFMALLIPYIMHYYLLENEVQKMYEQYDEILKYVRR